MNFTEYVYLTKQHGDLKPGQLREVSAVQAEEIKAAGAGYIADMSAYTKLEQKAEDALKSFKKLETRLKTSDDPRDGTPEVRAYVIAEAEAELKEEIGKIDAEWEAHKVEVAEIAKQAAATHTINVSTADRQLGEQFANRYAMQLAARPTATQQTETLDAMRNEIERLTDSQRVALQPHLVAINGVTKEGVSTTEIFRTAAQMQSPEAVMRELVHQYPIRPSTSYHQMRLIRERHNSELAQR